MTGERLDEVDRYLASLYAWRAADKAVWTVRARLLSSIGPRPGRYAGSSGEVRVRLKPSCTFDPVRVLPALERSGLLRSIATVDPDRLRAAVEKNRKVRACVGAHVAPFARPVVDPAPRRVA